MNLEKIDIVYLHKAGFASSDADNVCHVKTLPWLSIVQAQEGNYDIQLGNGEFRNTGNGGFFIAPSKEQQTIVHHADQDTGVMKCRWIFLDVKINHTYAFDDLYEFPLVVPKEKEEELNHYFNELFLSGDLFEEYACCYQILKILFEMAVPKRRKTNELLLPALLYIEQNFSRKITVEMLAKVSNMSASYFYAVFKKNFDISPIAYLNNLRLSLAAEYLLKTDDTIVEIAKNVGILDSVYFNKMFRKAYQVSPSQYRLKYRYTE